LVALWVLTDHKAAHANANIFLLAPWSVLLTAYGIAVALGTRKGARRAFHLATSAAGLACAGLAAKIFPGYSQDNGALIALLLPVWFGMVMGARWQARCVIEQVRQ